MADVKISELPGKAANLAGSDELEINEGGSSKKVTGQEIIDGTLAAVTSQTDAVITELDEILFADVSAANAVKKDTVQGILDLVTAGLPRSYLTGLVLSNGTDAANDIDIAVGVARSAADNKDLKLTSASGKQINASWAAGGTPGTPVGGLSSSLTLTADTWYNVILGLVSGTIEIGFDTSITGANLVTDHSFTNTRRLGAVLRETSIIKLFTQNGGDFAWTLPAFDVDVASPGTAAVTRVLSVPLGLVMLATVTHGLDANLKGQRVLISDLDITNFAPSSNSNNLATLHSSASEQTTGGGFRVKTDTASSVRVRNSINRRTRIVTTGWFDSRGQGD